MLPGRTTSAPLYLVECKKYSPERPVVIELVRQLHGFVQADKATTGILVTSSFFTTGARSCQSKVQHQMSLRDYVGIQHWLETILGPIRTD